MALSPSAETALVLAAGLAAAGLDKLPWSKPLKQWRDRVMFLRRAEGEESLRRIAMRDGTTYIPVESISIAGLESPSGGPAAEGHYAAHR